MKRVRTKKRYLALILPILILMLISYTYNTRANSLKNSKRSNQQVLRSNLIQNIIILDSATIIDSGSPASSEQHKIIMEGLEQNTKAISEALDKSDGALSAETKKQLSLEENILNTYSKNLATLSKLLSYSPIQDLGLVKNDPEELKKRSNASKEGVSNVLNRVLPENQTSIAPDRISLSKEALSSLEKSRDCFDRLSNGLTSLDECVKTYSETRQQLNTDLRLLWGSNEAKITKSNIKKLIAQLNT